MSPPFPLRKPRLVRLGLQFYSLFPSSASPGGHASILQAEWLKEPNSLHCHLPECSLNMVFRKQFKYFQLEAERFLSPSGWKNTGHQDATSCSVRILPLTSIHLKEKSPDKPPPYILLAPSLASFPDILLCSWLWEQLSLCFQSQQHFS